MIYPDNWLNRGLFVFACLATTVWLVGSLVRCHQAGRIEGRRGAFKLPKAISFQIICVILLNLLTLFESVTKPASSQQITVLFMSMITAQLLMIITALLKNDQTIPTPPS